MSATRGRLACLIPSLRGGGAERVMLRLARGFHARGHATDLLVIDCAGPLRGELPPGVELVHLGGKRAVGALPNLVEYLRNRRPEAMLSTLSHANLLALAAVSFAKVPVRVIVREANPHLGTRATHGVLAKAIPHLARILYPRADGIIAVSHGVADAIGRVVPTLHGRVQVIYNPVVDETLLRAAGEKPDHPWFSDDSVPVLLSTGRLTRDKDYPTLLRAFAILRRKTPVRLVILGEGELRSELESLVNELQIDHCVALPGFDPNPFSAMARARVFALTSISEGLPNVLIQAMACGCQVVSTDCESGPREILADGEFGRLVPVGNAPALAEAILSTLRSPLPAVKAQQQAMQLFGAEARISEYLKVLSPKLSTERHA